MFYHGNGVSKWIYWLLIDELSRKWVGNLQSYFNISCPDTAEAVLSTFDFAKINQGKYDCKFHVVLGLEFTEKFQERSEKYLMETRGF